MRLGGQSAPRRLPFGSTTVENEDGRLGPSLLLRNITKAGHKAMLAADLQRKEFPISKSCRRRPGHETVSSWSVFKYLRRARVCRVCVAQTIHKSHKSQVGQYSLMKPQSCLVFLQDLSSSQLLWSTCTFAAPRVKSPWNSFLAG